jgi:hypothetical protein
MNIHIHMHSILPIIPIHSNIHHAKNWLASKVSIPEYDDGYDDDNDEDNDDDDNNDNDDDDDNDDNDDNNNDIHIIINKYIYINKFMCTWISINICLEK